MAKTQARISFAVTVKLICVFVFAYTKIRFSHDTAHMCSLLESCYALTFLVEIIQKIYVKQCFGTIVNDGEKLFIHLFYAF